MKHLVRGSCAFALCGVLGLAGVAATPAAGGSADLAQIEVAMLPLEPTAQAMYAKHRGMFRKQGVDAKLAMPTPLR